VLFKPVNLFENYINNLFEMKQKAIAGSPLYLICKLLMNGLAGRFGMNPYRDNSVIVQTENTLFLSFFLSKNIRIQV
jgi:hypothetical protein